MALPIEKLGQGLRALRERRLNALRERRDSDVDPLTINSNLPPRQFHHFLPINQPTQIDLHDQQGPFASREANLSVESTPEGIKRRRMNETNMNDHKRYSSLDLSLKLSPPNTSLGNLPKPLKLPSSTHGASYLSSILDINGNLGELPSLIAMGCTHCLMYVVVPEAETKCPKCKNSKLIDKFRVNPTKEPNKN
ncbi:hypothetical protein RJT34_25584 [Clitoria ternatea]|uniref:GIR1-like zinc ribbon domain-containing protein n=1 Tax=Clitoria ternatea TaxID=43366 RepID=A0AAN9FQ74_CLITE